MARRTRRDRGDGTTPIIPEVAPNGRPRVGRQVALHHARVAELADAPGLGPGVRKDLGVRVPPLAPPLTCESLLRSAAHDVSETPSCSRLLTEAAAPGSLLDAGGRAGQDARRPSGPHERGIPAAQAWTKSERDYRLPLSLRRRGSSLRLQALPNHTVRSATMKPASWSATMSSFRRVEGRNTITSIDSAPRMKRLRFHQGTSSLVRTNWIDGSVWVTSLGPTNGVHPDPRLVKEMSPGEMTICPAPASSGLTFALTFVR